MTVCFQQLWVFPQTSRCAKILYSSQHADGRNRHQRLSRGVEPELQRLRASRRGRRHAACRACLTPAGQNLPLTLQARLPIINLGRD